MKTTDIFTALHKSIEKVCDILDDADELSIYRSVSLYAATGERSELEGVAGAIAEMAYALLDATKKKPRETSGTSTERVRRYRERQKMEQQETSHETSDETQRNTLHETQNETLHDETVSITLQETDIATPLPKPKKPPMTQAEFARLNEVLKKQQKAALEARKRETPLRLPELLDVK